MTYLRWLALILALILVPASVHAQKSGTTVMRVTAVQGAGMVYVRLLDRLKQNIESGTQGQVQVELLTNGLGGGEFEALKDQIRGRVEGGWISVLTLAQSLKAFRALTLPLVFNDTDQVVQFVDSPLDKAIRATATAKNLNILGYGSFGYYGIMLFEPQSASAKKFQDDALLWMKNRAIRVPEEGWLESVQEKLPGKVVRVPGIDLKKAVDSGWVNGLLTTPELMANKEWMRKASHFLNLRHLHAWSVFSVNRSWLESLPVQQRKVVQHEIRVMCDLALKGGLAHHETLVEQWYTTQHPQVVQASWDRMARFLNPLVLQTAQELDSMLGIYGGVGRVRGLWEANYGVQQNPHAPPVNPVVTPVTPVFHAEPTQGQKLASVMLKNRSNRSERP
ncbi:MAG: TRAP transporter substrate-binding protein DctP [Magnetococcus sp. THC-1_WYH]